MDNRIHVRVEIDPAIGKPEIVIRTDTSTGLTEKLIEAIESCAGGDSPKLTVYDGDKELLLEPEDIMRVYTEERRLMVSAVSGSFRSHLTLCEAEALLERDSFVRISRFEIVNLDRVSHFDMSITGTIRIIFEDGSETWVARRCVRTIREKLQLRNKGRA